MYAPEIVERPFVLLRASKSINLAYMKNPKSGCTSVSEWLEIASGGEKKSDIGDYHQNQQASYDFRLRDVNWIKDATVFSVVRHPLDRLVSAYVDKIARNIDVAVRTNFCNRYGLNYDREISFPVFLEAISSDAFPNELDEHWRPQYANLAFPYIVPNFICRLENMADDFTNFLQSIGKLHLGVPGHRHKHFSVNPEKISQLREFFADRAVMSMACDLYSKDFEFFSYRPNLESNLHADFIPTYSPHKHTRVGRLAEIVDANKIKTGDRLDFEFRRVLRDDLSGGTAQSDVETAKHFSGEMGSTKTHIEKIGLKQAALQYDNIDIDMHRAEANLLTSVCKICTTSAEQLQQEKEQLQREKEQLQREKLHANRYPWKYLRTAWKLRFGRAG